MWTIGHFRLLAWSLKLENSGQSFVSCYGQLHRLRVDDMVILKHSVKELE